MTAPLRRKPMLRAVEPKPVDVEAIAEAMQIAGIDRHRIYAFRKTGLVPTEATLHLFSRTDLAAWEAALAESRRRGNS